MTTTTINNEPDYDLGTQLIQTEAIQNLNSESDTHSIQMETIRAAFSVELNLANYAKSIRFMLENQLYGLIYHNIKIMAIFISVSLYRFFSLGASLNIMSLILNKINNQEFNQLVNYDKVVNCRNNMSFDQNCALIVQYCAIDHYSFKSRIEWSVALLVWNIVFWLVILSWVCISCRFLKSIYYHLNDSNKMITNTYISHFGFSSIIMVWQLIHLVLLINYFFSLFSNMSPFSEICEPTLFLISGYPPIRAMVPIFICLPFIIFSWLDINYLINIVTYYHESDDELIRSNDKYLENSNIIQNRIRWNNFFKCRCCYCHE
jgi:hypothetical protein